MTSYAGFWRFWATQFAVFCGRQQGARSSLHRLSICGYRVSTCATSPSRTPWARDALRYWTSLWLFSVRPASSQYDWAAPAYWCCSWPYPWSCGRWLTSPCWCARACWGWPTPAGGWGFWPGSWACGPASLTRSPLQTCSSFRGTRPAWSASCAAGWSAWCSYSGFRPASGAAAWIRCRGST